MITDSHVSKMGGILDSVLASANIENMIHALGLGAFYSGMGGYIAKNSPVTKEFLGLRPEQEIMYDLDWVILMVPIIELRHGKMLK